MDIKVGSLTFRLEVDSLAMLGDRLYAETQHTQQRILYSDTVPWERQRQSILHEIIHVVMDAYGPPETARDDENIALSLSRGLSQVFVDNPDLVSFLYGRDV